MRVHSAVQGLSCAQKAQPRAIRVRIGGEQMNMIKAVSDETAAVEINSVPLGAVVRVQEFELWS